MPTPPTEVRVRIDLKTGKIIETTNQVGEKFGDEPLNKAAINDYGIHVEKMTPIASFSSVVCDKKPDGCIIITRPDGSQFMLW
jgi:hypothetical protein